MKKYEFIKRGMDDYILKYKDQEIQINSKVEYVNKLQETTRIARIKMIADLKKQGLTVNDLVIETKKDGKTYIDNSSKEYMEQQYIKEEQQIAFYQIINEMFNKPFEQLATEIELTEDEMDDFANEMANVLLGKTPSEK